jgi:bifunctional DNA-binding transcriptional regulator/antitoxin component of YhaV-PrlF toxin-antitoxin module
MNKSWTLEVQEDQFGEKFIEFPPEAIADLGWKEGDTVEWINNGDGSWSIKKKEKVFVMVEAVQQFRMRYLVEVDADHPEWAMDTVVMKEAKEFSQQDMGETIVSHRVVTEEEALAISDIDNDYTKSWTKEQKIKAFFTRDGEKVDL